MRIKLKSGALHGYCKREDISRDELARRVGVTSVTAYRIDAGHVDPSPKFIAGLMVATSLPFAELFEIVQAEDGAA